MVRRVWTRLKALGGDERGVIALETTIVFPFQLLITMALIQLAHMYVASQTLQYAAYQGTRAAALEWDGTTKGLDESRKAAERVAWVILSPILNSDGGKHSIAVLPSRYYDYPSPDTSRLDVTLDIGVLAGSSASDIEVAAETVFAGTASYWCYMGVPVGGAVVHQVLGFGSPSKVRTAQGDRRLVRLRQTSYFVRPWPH